jgi:hypothetical protein
MLFDPARSGFTKTSVPADLRQNWETSLGGRLSAPVAAGGKRLAASIDRTPSTRWTPTPAGPVAPERGAPNTGGLAPCRCWFEPWC